MKQLQGSGNHRVINAQLDDHNDPHRSMFSLILHLFCDKSYFTFIYEYHQVESIFFFKRIFKIYSQFNVRSSAKPAIIATSLELFGFGNRQ
jgi:hypothetical protein